MRKFSVIYRPDIDGLRAIAILLVLIFHAGLSFFPSGFIGVDIFFVISGFLITGLIVDGLQKNTFSFKEFYSRRLWRLQPVFISLIIVASLLAWYFYLPDELVQYSKSVRKTALFVSNQFFARITSGYFSPDSNQLSLLHTWSLAIEWQCYLILPGIIYLVYRLFNANYHAKIIYLLTFIFLGLALYFSYHHPSKTYYQFCSRFFEFLIGSCVAFNQSKFKLPFYLLEIITGLALITIVYIARLNNISLGFPNSYAFILCLAIAILIIAGNQQPQPLITRLIASRPLVAIGLLSYSLYIWHWPIFAYANYQSLVLSPWIVTSLFGLIFVIAYLSWRFIEKPFRRFNQIKLSYTLVILLILPILTTSLSRHLIKHHDGYPIRFNDEVVRVYQQLKHYSNDQRSLCLQRLDTPINKKCLLGSKQENHKTALMIGDSFSNHAWGFVDTLAKKANISVLAHATASCLALPTISLFDWYEKNVIYQECYQQTARYFKLIKENHYDFVIIGQSWEGYFGDKIINAIGDKRSDELSKIRISQALDNTVQLIVNTGATPVLIKATALIKKDLHECFFDHIKHRSTYFPDKCSFPIDAQKTQWFDQLFVNLQKKYSQLIIIDPKVVQCPNQICPADFAGIPVFRDAAGHITDYASYQLGKNYLLHFNNPFLT